MNDCDDLAACAEAGLLPVRLGITIRGAAAAELAQQLVDVAAGARRVSEWREAVMWVRIIPPEVA